MLKFDLMPWVRLVRWNNLLIILLTQLLAWGCVIMPMRHYTAVPMLLNVRNFFCLSLSTILIAAAGYIINDYFDIKIDTINKPGKVILEQQIPRRMAIIAHSVLNIIALCLAAYVAAQAHHFEWLLLQVLCTLLLWFYSTHFKRQFMTGNIVVSLLTALTIITLMLYEPAIHYYITQAHFIIVPGGAIPNPVWVLGIYAYFAFMLTWMREIVKDIEDFKGDAEQGCITMPIKWGLQRAVRFIQALAILVVIPLIIASVKLIGAHWLTLGIYTSLALGLPVIIWAFALQKKNTTQHYHTASTQIKFIMLSGVVSLIIYYLQVHG